MGIIPEDLVEKTCQEVDGFSPARGKIEMTRLGKKQPALLSFMFEFTRDLDQEVQQLAIYMFFVVCRIFEKGFKKKIRKISPEEIINCYESNSDMMEKLDGAHEKFMERVAKTQVAAQPCVMKYVVDTLMEISEDDDPIDLTDDDTGYLFLLFKTVIDALNQTA